MKIRQADGEDISAIIAIDPVAQENRQRVQAIEKWLQNDTVLVVEEEEAIIGYGVFNHIFFGRGHVEILMIQINHRGKQVGEKLLKALETICDTPKIFITTNLSNQRMQRLLIRLKYRNCGFIEELDPGDPELVFMKKLEESS